MSTYSEKLALRSKLRRQFQAAQRRLYRRWDLRDYFTMKRLEVAIWETMKS